jgi:Flp pilus assembly protein TadB
MYHHCSASKKIGNFMKCYYHEENEAVAICKSCSRALCKSCAADVHPGTACINRCEKDVEALNLMIEKNKTAYQKTGKAYKRNAIALLLSGLAFSFIGIIPILVSKNYSSAFMVVLGFIFLLWSYFSYRSGKQIETTEKKAEQTV